MKTAIAIRYSLVVNAESEEIDYNSYLDLGLVCPHPNCHARVYYVKKGTSHQRTLKSGKVVEVKAKTPHFACFDINQCSGECGRKKSLSKKQLERLKSKTRGQRQDKIRRHFVEIYRQCYEAMMVDENLVLEVFPELLPFVSQFQLYFKNNFEFWIEQEYKSFINWKENPDRFEESLEEVRGKISFTGNLIVQDSSEKILKEKIKTFDFALHRLIVKETCYFLLQKKQQEVLKWLFLTLMSTLIAVKSPRILLKEKKKLFRQQSAALLHQLFLIPWGEMWEMCENDD